MTSKQHDGSRALSMDEFLDHKTSGGGKAAYLGKWKDSDGHKVDVWLHRKSPIVVTWRHNFLRLVPREDRRTKDTWTDVWSDNPICWEPEEVLKKQYKREDDGTRVVPPTVCPVCLLVEHVHGLVEAGELDWLEPIFRFDGQKQDGETVSVSLRASGLYNGIARDDLTDAEKKAMKAAKVFAKEAWKQNMLAKASYVFRVVEHSHPSKGVQVAVEPGLLGDKVRIAIRDRIEARGPDKGNPQRNPYPIRWKYLPDEQEFGKKYAAVALDESPTAEVLRLITETDPPNIKRYTSPCNPKTLRAVMERHALVELPWADFFAKAEGLWAEQGGEEEEGPESERPKAAAAPEVGNVPAGDEEMVGCDKCGKPMRGSASKCPHCGAEYEVEAEELAPPPPVKLPKRSEARAVRAAAQKQAPQAKAGKSEPEPTPAEDDDIPF